MNEIWKSIKNYERLYEISNLGKVKSLPKKWTCGKHKIVHKKDDTILKYGIDGNGYCIVVLCKNRKPKTFKISHLVWDYFGDRLRNGRKLQVDHIDNNKQNDRIDNLQLLTCRGNISKWHLQNGKKTSQFTGISWDKKTKKWEAKIWIDGKKIYLGRFNDEINASLAYQNILKNITKIKEKND